MKGKKNSLRTDLYYWPLLKFFRNAAAVRVILDKIDFELKIDYGKGELRMLAECLDAVRERAPLVHCITNYVTVNDVANILLACGGSPIMADEPDDAEEITAICGGLTINIGTLNHRTIEAMHRAGRKARELGHTLLLDPVGAGASRLRTGTAVSLMEELHFDVIRGNVSELKALALGSTTTQGVDANAADAVREENLEEMISFTKSYAASTGAIIAITGAIDLVADSCSCFVIRNGRPEMGRITGTGCQLSAMMNAYVTANPDRKLEAAAAATVLMGLSGEIGWDRMQPGDGNSTYRNRIIDAVFNMDGKTLEEGAKIERR